MGMLAEDNYFNLTDDEKAVKNFFKHLDVAYSWGTWGSHWHNRDRKKVTLEEIILWAMKKPTDKNGDGGSATAQILFHRYGILVERNHEHESGKQRPDNQYAQPFYDAWLKVRKSEKDALHIFHLLHKAKKKEDAKTSCFRTYSQVEPIEDQKSIPETKRSLVSLIKSTRTGYLTRFFAALGCPRFFSGNRSHEIFNTQSTVYLGATGTPVFGINTRKAATSEEAATQIINSIKKPTSV